MILVLIKSIYHSFCVTHCLLEYYYIATHDSTWELYANAYLMCYYIMRHTMRFEWDLRTVWTSFIIHAWRFLVTIHSHFMWKKKTVCVPWENKKNKNHSNLERIRVSKWCQYFSILGVNHSLQSKPQHFSKTMHVKHLHKPLLFFLIFFLYCIHPFSTKEIAIHFCWALLCSVRPGKLWVKAWSLMYISSSTHTLLWIELSLFLVLMCSAHV